MRRQHLIPLLLAVGLLGLRTPVGFAQRPAQLDPQLAKELEELERRLQKLQDKLKSVKESATPGQQAAATAGLPAHLDKLFAWRSIGPANMSGRITGIAVFEGDPCCYYVATASGGLLKTENNGSTFTHQFDHESTVSIGAVAVAPTNRNIVWVGTGEANPRNSVSYGDGVYRSDDGGKTWKNMGLRKSYQIGKIIIHPKNPDIVYVGVLGRLYGPSEERGLYKTTDSGKSWHRVWFLDNKTGVLDIALQPGNPEVILMASWERQRDGFDSFMGEAKAPEAADAYAPAKEHGPGSGIYKSTDGGKSWKKITQGLAKANYGRIGLDWSRHKPGLVFAIVDSEKGGMGLPPPKALLGLVPENTPTGVRIADVKKDSPAANAKLEKGDLLLALDGKDLKKTDDLLVPLQPRKPGEKIKLTYERGKKKDTAEITLGSLTRGKGKKGKGGGRGGMRGSLGIQMEDSEDGLMITDVVEKGPGHKGGLKVGDVLVEIDDIKIDALPVVFKTLFAKKVGDKIKLTYQRGKEKKSISVTLEPPSGPPGRPYGGMLGGQRANVQDQQGPDGNDTGGIYQSTDAGESWTRINSLNERPFYFSVVRADPKDEKTIYAMGVELYRSTDGGKKFSTENLNKGLHSDLHDMWIDPKDPRHLLVGTDGGVYVSYDKGANWEHLDYLAAGQFYHVAVDAERPYHVYGGLQDNGSWCGPSQTLRPSGPTNSDFQFVLGGDGFVCRVDPLNPHVVYAESQNGFMFRRDMKNGQGKLLRPKMKAGLGKYRFNWNTPYLLSQHNANIFYAAGNYVFRSVKQGEGMKILSPEITRTKHGSGSALAESPKDPDVLWAGTDDGAIWLTRDGGKNWTELSDKFKSAGLPGPRWVATIEPSRTLTGRCYVVFDAHRSDDDEPHVFVTEDYGQTWKSLRANLPTGSSRVLREDWTDPDILYLGTEFAAYVSLDRGKYWIKINGSALPTVAVHEFAQPITANEIVAATHGRSLWVLDVTSLRQLKPKLNPVHLFAPAAVTRWQLDSTRDGMFQTGTRQFVGQNPARDAVLDFVLAKKADKLSLKVFDLHNGLVRDIDLSKEKEPGLHRIHWDLVADKAPKDKKSDRKPFTPYGQPVKPAAYRLVLQADGVESTSILTVEPDPRTQSAGTAANEAEELRRLLRQRP